VIREALRLLNERDQLRELRLTQLSKEIATGIEQADRGEVAPLNMKATKAKARSRKKTSR